MIHILKGGLLTTVQDQGRIGFQKFGVVTSGAMDRISYQLANDLVGNQAGEAALEITLNGTIIEFEEDCIIAITGANLKPMIFGKPVQLNRPICVRKGSILRFGYAKQGCRCYLSVAGGIAVPEVMGSKSTYLRAQLGGWKGRSLRKGDHLPVGKENERQKYRKNKLLQQLANGEDFLETKWAVTLPFQRFHSSVYPVRVIQGRQANWFTRASLDLFTTTSYHVTNDSDRMGYRLQGSKLQLRNEQSLLSEATTLGTIQVPTNGQPICLMNDRQSTGGYPKIADIIQADLPILAQAKPGDELQFRFVSITEAHQALMEQYKAMERLKLAITWKWEEV